MKRAAGAEVGTRLAQRNVTLDDVHDIDSGQKFLDKRFWNHGADCMPGATASGSQLGFDQFRHFAHVGSPGQLGLQ